MKLEQLFCFASTRSLLFAFLLCFCLPALADATYPIKVSANGRYLVDQNNTPFLINGDTAWTLVNSLSKSEITTYFADCKAKGINAVMWEMIQSVPYSSSSSNAPINAEGNAPFGATDFVDMLEPYWAHVDWIVAEAAAYDIVLFSYPSYMEPSTAGWQDEMVAAGTAVMASYGTWIGARYKNSPNIVWVGGGDTPATGSLADVHNAMMNALSAEDPNHLITAHSNRERSALDDYNQPWLTLNSTYSNLNTTLSETETDWNRIGTLPTFFLEGEYIPLMNDQQARYQAYSHVFGGGSGHFYGNWEIWPFESTWQSALDESGRASLLHFKRLFDSRPSIDIVPDYARTVITAGFGGPEPFVVMGCLSNSGDTFMAYFPSTSYTITVNMGQLGGTESKVHWFNVRDGSASLEGTYSNSGTRQFTPPGSGDWVLVIDNDALNLPAPGAGSAEPPTIPKPPVIG